MSKRTGLDSNLDPLAFIERYGIAALESAIDKEECERDLLAFVRLFWHVVDPEEPFVSGWPVEAICLPWNAKIMTRQGPQNIRDIVENGGSPDEVLSFNHHLGCSEWRRVVGRSAVSGKSLIKVTLANGYSLRLTDNHPVYVSGSGYVRADQIVCGQSLAVLHDEEVRVLRGRVSDARAENQILQPGVLWESESPAGKMDMPVVRLSKELGREILHRLLRQEANKEFSGAVPKLRNAHASQSCADGPKPGWAWGVLQHILFRLLYTGPELSLLFDGDINREIPARILSEAPRRNSRPRWRRLLSVLAAGRVVRRSSYRPQPVEQRSLELGGAVQAMPQRAAQRGGRNSVGESVVSKIEREERIPAAVYNIAVDGNHNYFADGVLVHNCDHLMAVTDGEITRLIINVPPGFTKSMTTGVMFPAWEWGPANLPHLRYICAAYTSSLTVRDNARFQRIVMDDQYRKLWGDRWTPDPEHWPVTKPENNKTGWKLATSVSGVGTGERGNRILVDDANNPKDVESETVRAGTNMWVREVMPDRLNNLKKDAIICIQQRTHDEDASGTLLEHGRGYVHLNVPMEYDPTRHCVTAIGWQDPRGVGQDGEQLEGVYEDKGAVKVRPNSPADLSTGILAWPDRFAKEQVDEQKQIKGPFGFSSQYQQLPVPRGGGIIRREWWRLWSDDDFPDFGTVIAALDTAVEEGEENDYNALTVWGAFPGDRGRANLMLIDAWRQRSTLAELVQRVGDTCRKRKADILLIEHKTRGRDVEAEIKRRFGNREWSTLLIPVVADKVARLTAAQPFFSGEPQKDPLTGNDVWPGGDIWAPDKDWAEMVIDETEKFPRGAHDDYVDTVSLAVNYVRRNGVILTKEEFAEEELEARRYKKPKPATYDV